MAERKSALENMVMEDNFWKDKTVMITGHTGFKGSWLCLWLQCKGAKLIGYSLPPPTNPSLFEIAGVAKNMKSIVGDIRDLDHFSSIITKYRPEIIIHMAAQSLVRFSYENPVDTYSTNIMGTVHVLEAARMTNCVKVILVITSDKCYENKEWIWSYREKDPLGGRDPYSSSKGCAELVTAAYRESFFSSDKNAEVDTFIASTRAGNVIGGGDWAKDRLIPDMVRSILKNSQTKIRYPNAVRPWQYVLEPLAGYLKLAEKLCNNGNEFVGAWNFGPNEDDAKPVWWIADRLIYKWGNDARWISDPDENVHEATYLKLDCSKARALLEWKPKLNIEESLSFTVDWYKAYASGKDMRAITIEEIARYEKISSE